MAKLFLGKDRFDDARAHAERAKSHATNDPYNLGRAMEQQARIWWKERKFEEAKSEVLHAASVFEKIGAAKEAEGCRAILRDIEEAVSNLAPS